MNVARGAGVVVVFLGLAFWPCDVHGQRVSSASSGRGDVDADATGRSVQRVFAEVALDDEAYRRIVIGSGRGLNPTMFYESLPLGQVYVAQRIWLEVCEDRVALDALQKPTCPATWKPVLRTLAFGENIENLDDDELEALPFETSFRLIWRERRNGTAFGWSTVFRLRKRGPDGTDGE